ncbi:MAG TPA: hypothetical protein VKV17_06745, partial [Bryobacteraceae bacterium]|nr:hypothetical protein [Bryobacteraceae bacterium]
EHARALAALRARSSALIAIVLPAPSQSDPARAAVESLSQPDRARMAAALRMVDYVLIANPHSLQGLLATLEPAEILHLDEIEAALAARRLRRVLEHA